MTDLLFHFPFQGGGRRGEGEEKRAAEDEMVDGITDSMDMNLGKPGDGEGQGSLACCSPRGRKEADTTE